MLNLPHWIKKRPFITAATFPIIILYYIGTPSSVQGDVYKWQDDTGTIHFTDNPSSIPKSSWEEVKKLKSAHPKSTPAPEINLQSIQKSPKSNYEFIIPMETKGNQFFIDAKLNGQTEAKLLLDTGATTIVLSEKLAKKLGFALNNTMPQVQAGTAGGEIWAPLLSLREVRVGNAVADEVEAIISLDLKKVDGLMGMSFLSQFRMNLDYSASVLILKPFMEPPLYDGKTKQWWKEKLNYYRSKIRLFKELAENLKNKGDTKAFNVEKTVLHYQTLYTKLVTRGKNARIPFEIKLGPQ